MSPITCGRAIAAKGNELRVPNGQQVKHSFLCTMPSLRPPISPNLQKGPTSIALIRKETNCDPLEDIGGDRFGGHAHLPALSCGIVILKFTTPLKPTPPAAES